MLVLVERRARVDVRSFLSLSGFSVSLSPSAPCSSGVPVLSLSAAVFFGAFLRAEGFALAEVERLRVDGVRRAALFAITSSSTSLVLSGATASGVSSFSDAPAPAPVPVPVPVAALLRPRPLPPRRPRRERLGDPLGLGVDVSPSVDSSADASPAKSSEVPAAGFLGLRDDAERFEGLLVLLRRRTGDGAEDPDFEAVSPSLSPAWPSPPAESESDSESAVSVRAVPEAGRLLRPRPPRLRGLRGAPVAEEPEPVDEVESVFAAPSDSSDDSPCESESEDGSGAGRASPAEPAGTTAVSGSSIMLLPSRECAAGRNEFGSEPEGTAESFRQARMRVTDKANPEFSRHSLHANALSRRARPSRLGGLLPYGQRALGVPGENLRAGLVLRTTSPKAGERRTRLKAA